jgi:secondary thiamine-phosphate synthase enzyme
MIAEHTAIECSTNGNDHIVDLTRQVQRAVAETGVRTGQAALLVQGSTASLTTIEYEPGLVNHDVAAALETMAPRSARYKHEETWHDENGHSHVRAALVGPSLALPVIDGRVPLGQWQQIVLIDSDTRPRERTIHLSVVGV